VRVRLASPVGLLEVTVGTLGVEELAIGRKLDSPGAGMPGGRDSGEPLPPLVRAVRRELDEYFSGARERFEVPVDLACGDLSPFQRHVLLTLRAEVPYGETVTYGELAELAGRPGAARAVGTAMRKNPVQLLVPCHRVVAAKGIGGYGGGPQGVVLKRALLAREGREWSSA
jgi:methylated-DNA-[protein]-cysteine S-methyltransferase